MVGLVAALFGIAERRALAASFVAALTAGAATGLNGFFPAFAAPAALVIVGLFAVSGRTPNHAGAMCLAAVSGMSAGLAADLDAASWAGALGVGVTMVFIVGCAFTAFPDLSGIAAVQRVLPIAKRVLGSWVTAIGLLMTALALHGGKI